MPFLLPNIFKKGNILEIALFFKTNQEKTFLKVKISKNSREKPQNSRKNPKTQGKNSSSRSFDTRPRSKLVLKKMPDLEPLNHHQ